MKNKILKNIGIVILFVVILISFFVTFSKIRSTSLLKTVSSIKDINSGNVQFSFTQNSSSGNINYIYNFNFDKNYKYTKENKVHTAFATDGTFGIEVESLELGLYLPLKMVFEDDIDIYAEIDESYEDIFGIPGGKNVHTSLTSLRKNLGVNIEYAVLEKDFIKIKEPLIQYVKNINDNFIFYRSENQGITTGIMGRLSGSLTKEHLEELYNIFKNNLEKQNIEKYYLDSIFSYLINNFSNAIFSIDIYGGVINKVSLIGPNSSIVIELSNVNNPNTINIPFSGYIELVQYLSDGAESILELFGFEVETTLTRIEYLKESFANFATYMIASIDYSDSLNFEYTEVCLNNMDAIINDMKTKIFNKEDESVNTATYNKYIEFLTELLNYCTIYQTSCKDSTVDVSSNLQESVDKLNEISKVLNIDISNMLEEGK